jgi:hypothetical protein
MAEKQFNGTQPEFNNAYRMYSPSIDSMMREVMHMLGNIDFQHEVEMERLEQSNTDQELKKYIKEKIKAAYRERREPYVDLLAELRKQQHRMSFAA